jgi:hypothetical protein
MGIVVAAIITALLCLGVYGTVLWLIAPREERRLLALLIVLELPMSVGMFYLVRLPFDGLVHGFLGDAGVYRWLTTLYAPLTEEPAKLWPLLIPLIARRVGRDSAVRAAVALGLGFGLGEIALVAKFVLDAPQFAGLPWYSFGGFMNERFMVCITHGLFATMSVCGLRRWRIGLPGGLLIAMSLHFLANIAIPLVRVSPLGNNAGLSGTILTLWVTLFWVAAIVVLPLLNGPIGASAGTTPPGTTYVEPGAAASLFGTSSCPSCGRTYAISAFALNLGVRRLERCPHCKRWHLASQFEAKG